MKNICQLVIGTICLVLSTLAAASQAKLVINGGIITISNNASLVIDNPDNTAIVYNGTGYIQSEGSGNRLIWTIGPGNGNACLVPFGNAAGYLPLQFTASSGNGAGGQFIFSTYPTATWKNSDDLPPGVTNVNRSGIDNSANVIDRFWQINPQGYTIKPTLTNLVLSYTPADFAAPNTITETNLIAQRWNSVLNSWSDYIPPAVTNTANKTVMVPAIAGNQLYNWWTLVDFNAALPLTLIRFTAMPGNNTVLTSWQTALEQHTDHFEVWRSRDGQQFDYAGSVAAAGFSNGIINYALTDRQPYAGTSYYRLKSVDRDGKFTWSVIVTVTINNNAVPFLFPNPAHNFITISSNSQLLATRPLVHLYDAKASLLQTFTLSAINQTINTAMLPAGVYRLNIRSGNNLQILSFIKN